MLDGESGRSRMVLSSVVVKVFELVADFWDSCLLTISFDWVDVCLLKLYMSHCYWNASDKICCEVGLKPGGLSD